MSEQPVKRSIPFSPPDIGELEIEEVARALRSGWITTGPRTKLLERRLAAYLVSGRVDVDCDLPENIEAYSNRTVCLNSATAAEELNLRLLGVGPGDEVIVPAYTYTASASAAIHCGATVVFADIVKDGDPLTHAPEMDYDAVGRLINEKTKAVVPVDFGGIVCDYDRLRQVLEEKKGLFRPASEIQEAIGRVAIVADCAHAIGASRGGKMAGTMVDFASYSFHAVKNFTTAEGGCSVWNVPGADNAEVYKQYQLYSLHGQNKDALAKSRLGAWEYDIVGPWYKCNLTDIMAAIGLRQLDRYPELLCCRKEIVSRYDAAMDELGVDRLHHYGEGYESSGHLYTVRIPGIGEERRNAIITALAERGVSANVHYKPLPMMTAYKPLGWRIEDFPNSFDYYRNLITLPLHTKLSDEDVAYVIDSFRDILRKEA